MIIQNEYDLHCQVVKFIRKKYPNVVLIVGLGELQDTSSKRVAAFNKGYKGGQPDLILLHANEEHNGMAIEFKNPNGTGRLSAKQETFLMDLHSKCNYTVLVSNDYDEIVEHLIDYIEYSFMNNIYMETVEKKPKQEKPKATPRKKKEKPQHFCNILYYLNYPEEERKKMFTVEFH